MTQPLRGLIAATLTPFDASGKIVLDKIPGYVDFLIQTGIRGLYVCGSTGEGVSLSTEERKAVTEAFMKATKQRVPVIVQTGHNSLAETKSLTEHAAQAGADILSATCPSYFKITETQTLLDYVVEIAAAAPDLPFYYYHIPALTGSTIDIVEFLEKASERIPNLRGVKYTDTKLFEFQECQSLTDGKLDIVWGCDEMLLGALATGASAAIGSTYNAAAGLSQEIIEAFESGNIKLARERQLLSVKFIRILLSYPFHAALRYTMSLLGQPLGPSRLPLPQLSSEQEQKLGQELSEIGIDQF